MTISQQPWTQEKERLQEILAREEYQMYMRGSEGSWWEWVKSLLRRLLGYLPDFALSGGSVEWVSAGLLAGLLILTALAVYWFTRQLVRQKRVRRTAAYMPASGGAQSPSHYWNQASVWAAQGQWREGVRALFLTLVCYLDRQGEIRLQPWKTNLEYEEELASGNPELSRVYHECALLFERVWYGKDSEGEAAFDLLRRRVAPVVGEGGGGHAERA